MASLPLWARVQGRYRRSVARFLFRRPFEINSKIPFVSFTFDDFPRSALLTGGAILKHFGLTGTYYASFGLMGKQAPTGTRSEEHTSELQSRLHLVCRLLLV